MPLVVSAKGKRFLDTYARARAFRSAIPAIETSAAATATKSSRETFTRQLGHRALAPSRAGRLSTGGTFGSLLLWTAKGGNITLDFEALPWYWVIQEVGTGNSATILDQGRRISIPKQSGREISANLFWASGPGGNVSAASSGGIGTEQLYYASELNAQSVANSRRRKKRIRREIKGKHFIAIGGAAGLVQLRQELVDEARRTFR